MEEFQVLKEEIRLKRQDKLAEIDGISHKIIYLKSNSAQDNGREVELEEVTTSLEHLNTILSRQLKEYQHILKKSKILEEKFIENVIKNGKFELHCHGQMYKHLTYWEYV